MARGASDAKRLSAEIATSNHRKKGKMPRQRLGPSSPSWRSIPFGEGLAETGQTRQRLGVSCDLTRNNDFASTTATMVLTQTKPSVILMLYSHRQHHLHCAQRHLVHMIVKGLACRMRKKPSPSSKNAPEAARRLRARAAAASWLVPMQGWTKAACQMSSASAAGPYQTTGCEGRRWPAARSHCGIEAPC